MKRNFFSLLTFLAIAASIQAQTVDEIVDNHIKATGGKEAYAQIKTAKMTGKSVMGPGQEAPMTITSINGKAFRMEFTIQGMTMVQAVKGDKGWMIMPFQGNSEPQPLTPDQVKEMSSQLDLTGDFYNYKEKGSQIELVGTDDMEGTEVYKLKVTKKDGVVSYHFIDKESYYDLKQTQKVMVKDKEMETVTMMSNYKKTNTDLILPHAMSGDMGEMQWTSIEINAKVDEKIFDMPGAKATNTPTEKPTEKPKKEKVKKEKVKKEAK